LVSNKAVKIWQKWLPSNTADDTNKFSDWRKWYEKEDEEIVKDKCEICGLELSSRDLGEMHEGLILCEDCERTFYCDNTSIRIKL